MRARKHHDADLMERLYVELNLTISEVADKVGCTYKTARRWLIKHEIEIDSSANGSEKQKNQIVRVCGGCGEEIEVQRWQAECYEQNFCDEDCMADGYTTGRGWSDGYGTSWYDWRDKIRQRDGNVCQRCGDGEEEIGHKPHVHHIVPIKEFDVPDDSHRMMNMVQLCPSCHMIVERGPDPGDRMPVIEQMEAFM